MNQKYEKNLKTDYPGDRKPVEANQQEKNSMILPASNIQRQFWLLNQLHPDSPAYNVSLMFRLKGPLNFSALKESINEIIRCHDVFRTTFRDLNGELVQVISPRLNLELPIIDPGSHPDSHLESEIKRLVRIEIEGKFDLSNGPLIRTKLLRLSELEHIFLIIMHHTITDLSTEHQLVSELETLYNSFLAEKPHSLEKPTHQYADYAAWQKEWLKGEEFSSMLSFWKQKLSDHNGFLDIPTYRQRPPVQSLKGTSLPLEFTTSFTNDLKRFSSRENVPLFITLLTAYLVLLYRYSRQKNITIGIPFTNRRRKEWKDIMGCFVNILPLSFDLSDSTDFREVMSQVRKEMLGAHRHQEVPYESIVNEMKLKRNPSYNPLYQVGFTFAPLMTPELQGLTVEPLNILRDGSQLDMFVTLWDSEQGVHGQIEYNTDLYDNTTISRFSGHFLTLLEAVTRDVHRPISQLTILTEPEKKQLLHDWNATDVHYPRESCIHRLFEMQADRTPDAIAVQYEDELLSYKELNQRANQLAHYMQSKGVGHEVLVGVYMERSADMLTGVLGVLKSGGAYVPLDPDFPKDRIAYMLDHSEVRVILTQQRLKEELPGNRAHIVCLDTDWTRISKEKKKVPAVEAKSANLAYVIYTSGSTGKPKGVQVPHLAAVNFLVSMSREPGITKNDVLLAVTTLSFDISVLELFLPLIAGAKTVILGREKVSDGNLLLDALKRSEATIMQATPVTWRLLIAAGWTGSDNLKILCGGETLSIDLARELIGRTGSVWNMYGPTETTVWSSCDHLTNVNGPIVLGRPIANTQFYILDSQMQPVPVGIPGEIHIGGDGVTRGYLKQPDMTREKFIQNPFSTSPDARLYKTGDIGRYLSDGNIEYLYRNDNQVKVRGFRIETGEIEAVLIQHPQVWGVVVIARKDPLGDTRLIGYIVPVQGEKPTVESLRGFLQEKLPYYMVPTVFVPMEEFPLTPNKKIDRKALPDPDHERPEMDQHYVSPSTDSEKIMTDIWCQVLGLDRVGVHDNFFDLGGNSLLSTQIMSRVQKELGINVSVIKLFQYSTISSLVHYLNLNGSDQPSYQKVQKRAQRRKAAISHRSKLVRQL